MAERIDEFIAKLKELKQVTSPFTLVSTEELVAFDLRGFRRPFRLEILHCG
jgi:hypothetical protein